ncbi:hypothetical protein WOC76_21715 [Methylocystis sp. IM3]|uniref:hypothetical protein n=1 Tax=unclassified Methylocystis TaxID=2625913 RepID=UPI0030F77E22
MESALAGGGGDLTSDSTCGDMFKLRRSMVDPNREPLEGVVEVDQTQIPFRADDAFFDPGASGKILIAGAVEVIDRDTNQANPRRKHAKSGPCRVAVDS